MNLVGVGVIIFWLSKIFQKQLPSENIFHLHGEKTYSVHNRTESGLEIAFHLFSLGIPEASFIIKTFRMLYIQIFLFSTCLAQNV